jgi:hypothetical protein
LIWPLTAALGVLLLLVSGVNLGGFSLKKWPFVALGTLNHQSTAARLFHEQDWGGLIAAECQPARRTYLDDRFEIYGKEGILEYCDVLSGGPVWDTVLDRDQIEMVWVRPDRGLAKRLLKEPGWEVLYRDKISILFRHVPMSKLTAR